MKLVLKQQLHQTLLEAEDYRKFLASAVEVFKKENSRFTIAAFARRCGFKARSYPRDVIVGRRDITPQSLPFFVKGLGLATEMSEYFSLLVARQHPELRPEEKNIPEAMEKLVQSLRKRQNRLERKREEVLFQIKDWPKVYAALGSVESGSRLSEIQSRSQLGTSSLLQILAAMLEKNLIRYDSSLERYFPLSGHIVFPGMDDGSFFKDYYLNSLAELMRSAKSEFSAPDKLFLNSTFSIQAELLPRLKTELKDLLLKYVDKNESSRGDTVKSLVVGLC